MLFSFVCVEFVCFVSVVCLFGCFVSVRAFGLCSLSALPRSRSLFHSGRSFVCRCQLVIGANCYCLIKLTRRRRGGREGGERGA